jgi:hypothetical protein
VTADIMQRVTGRGRAGVGFNSTGDTFSAAADEHDLCGLDPAAFDVERAAAILRSDPTVERQLRFRMSEARVSIRLFLGQREMAEDLLTRLRATP